MYSDPKDCLYCTNNETLHNLMIEICHLRVSRLFLFKEQTYRGRCLVAYDGHVNDLNELNDQQRNDFMADVAQATRAMQRAFNPEKINSGAYSDKWRDRQRRSVSRQKRGLRFRRNALYQPFRQQATVSLQTLPNKG